MTQDYSKLSDREIDVEVARAFGCMPHYHDESRECICYPMHAVLTGCPQIYFYSTSWEFAGPLLEMMPDGFLSHHTSQDVWACVFKNIRARSEVSQSPTRAICESFLKWRDIDSEAFAKAVNK